MARLGVNIDHIATLRQLRKGKLPDLLKAALICEISGADSIVAHLREDRRHIQEKDLMSLRKNIRTKLNLEMSTYDDIVKIACSLRPNRATLVPEKRQELTTEGGLDVVKNFGKIKRVVGRLNKSGIGVSLFIDPDKKQLKASADLGIKMVELHTGRYANALNRNQQHRFIEEIKTATEYAKRLKINVFAGHGLDYNNVSLVAGIKDIEEFNIGYSIICHSLIVGLGRAVREMKDLLR
jgi:pyridoxine 5-phosphate synthase